MRRLLGNRLIDRGKNGRSHLQWVITKHLFQRRNKINLRIPPWVSVFSSICLSVAVHWHWWMCRTTSRDASLLHLPDHWCIPMAKCPVSDLEQHPKQNHSHRNDRSNSHRPLVSCRRNEEHWHTWYTVHKWRRERIHWAARRSTTCIGSERERETNLFCRGKIVLSEHSIKCTDFCMSGGILHFNRLVLTGSDDLRIVMHNHTTD